MAATDLATDQNWTTTKQNIPPNKDNYTHYYYYYYYYYYYKMLMVGAHGQLWTLADTALHCL